MAECISVYPWPLDDGEKKPNWKERAEKAEAELANLKASLPWVERNRIYLEEIGERLVAGEKAEATLREVQDGSLVLLGRATVAEARVRELEATAIHLSIRIDELREQLSEKQPQTSDKPEPPMPEGWEWQTITGTNGAYRHLFCRGGFNAGSVFRHLDGDETVATYYSELEPAHALYLAHVLKRWAETGEVPRV